jgi:RimJ/RimL family protein N-acetyltransferase
MDDVIAMELSGTAPASRARAVGFPRTEDLEAVAAWERGGAGFLIVDRDGVVVGTCGTHGPLGAAGELELGWGLVESARGVGVGGDAVDLLLAVVRDRYPAARVVAHTESVLIDGVSIAASPASEAILTRRGFVPGPAPAAPEPRSWSLSEQPR